MELIAPTVSVSWRINPEGELSAAMRGHGVRLLAHEVGVSPQTVSNWIAGSVAMDDSDLVAVCHRIGVRAPSIRYAQGSSAGSARSAPRVRFQDAMIRKRARAQAGGAE